MGEKLAYFSIPGSGIMLEVPFSSLVYEKLSWAYLIFLEYSTIRALTFFVYLSVKSIKMKKLVIVNLI